MENMVQSDFSIQITLYDADCQEIDLREFEEEFGAIAEMVDAGTITAFDEILGHLWLRVQTKRMLSGN